jgi:hypothetical protein
MDIQVLSEFFITDRILLYTDDVYAVSTNRRTDSLSVVLPRWIPPSDQHADRSEKISEAFVRVATSYRSLLVDSPAVDAADQANASAVDILGRSRAGTGNPDMMCSERMNSDTLLFISR